MSTTAIAGDGLRGTDTDISLDFSCDGQIRLAVDVAETPRHFAATPAVCRIFV